MKVTKKYLNFYSPYDYDQMKAVKEKVFYENNGKLYTQFFEGDLLPIAVYEEIFGSSEDMDSVEENVSKTSQEETEEKLLSVEETQADTKDLKKSSELAKKESPKPRKKREKSIIKK